MGGRYLPHDSRSFMHAGVNREKVHWRTRTWVSAWDEPSAREIFFGGFVVLRVSSSSSLPAVRMYVYSSGWSCLRKSFLPQPPNARRSPLYTHKSGSSIDAASPLLSRPSRAICRVAQLAVEIEDGTAVVRVRLSEQLTRRLFGVEAREFKKIYQSDEDQASRIQVRWSLR